MAQLNWTYYSLTGRPYIIDMYHGDDSRHLMLFVNGEIIFINFNVKETCTKSFYIEHQLLELDIKEKEHSEYEYILTPQKLPEPEDEEKLFSHHFWIPLIILIIALNLTAFLLIK